MYRRIVKLKPTPMDALKYLSEPQLNNPVLLAGFGGWGNAGEVATSTIDYLVEH